MRVAAAPGWLDRLYVLALLVHASLAVVLIGGALATFVGFAGQADAAPDSGWAGLAIRLLMSSVWLFAAIIPVLVLLSWGLLRRRGVAPSPGHKALAVAGTLPFAGAIAMGVVQ